MQEYIDSHVNEMVERRNFRSHRQLPGESFDDFLIALCKVVKTCKFCSDQCMQKNLRDEVVEGLRDIETIKDVLKENNLTLDNAIAKCRSLEAGRKHCLDMTRQEPEVMAALQITQRGRTKATVGQGICSGCGGAWHKGGHQQCPAYNRTCAHCHKRVTLPRCVVVRQHNRGQHRHQPMLSMWIHNKTARSKYGCTQ